MRHTPGRFLLLALLASLSLSLACRQSSQPAAPPQSGQTESLARERVVGSRGGSLSYRIISPVGTFNYLLAADEPSVLVSNLLLGGRLADFDHDQQAYVPGLAESWKLQDDGRTLEMTLRDGLKFSDGHELTADDVSFTFRALYDERTASPIFRSAMLIGGKPIEVAVVDARHLRLTFPGPVAVPESYLSNLAVLPRHILEAEYNAGRMKESWSVSSDPQRVVTAGAFTVESSAPGERVVLKRNPYYWKKDTAGTQLPYLDNISIEVITDANATLARLNQNSLDIYDRIRPTDYASLRSASGAVRAYDLGPGLVTDYVWFNLNEGERDGQPIVAAARHDWFADARFRRAVAHSIDRASIANNTLQGLATPLYGFISPGNRVWVAADVPRAEYDLERARSLLGEAGFTTRGTTEAPELYDAKGNAVEFTLIVPVESEPRKAEAAVVQEDLARLGIRMQVAPIEVGELTRRRKLSLDYDAILFGASVSQPDPSSYANFLQSSSDEHQWHPNQTQPATEWEARLDQLTEAQARERDQQRRLSIFRDIQQLLVEQMPIVPIVARHIIVAANTRLGNYRPSPIFPYSLWNADELFIRK
ncbi:MAG TPA: ABC transporter substrate-binding protein [Pyrinomonadaceae bacterium]